jgi:hypothetical protein
VQPNDCDVAYILGCRFRDFVSSFYYVVLPVTVIVQHSIQRPRMGTRMLHSVVHVCDQPSLFTNHGHWSVPGYLDTLGDAQRSSNSDFSVDLDDTDLSS